MQDSEQASPTGAPSVRVVILPGEIDLANDQSVSADLDDALASGATVVIADMTSTTFIDTSGVRALVLAHKAAATKSAELRVAVSSPRVLRTLSILRLDKYLSIYPTVTQAQAAGTVTGEPLPG
jgi:anti-sigma B factor antagonist